MPPFLVAPGLKFGVFQRSWTLKKNGTALLRQKGNVHGPTAQCHIFSNTADTIQLLHTLKRTVPANTGTSRNIQYVSMFL